jgi:glycosyltransferase involved in cell wall biosynthesis
MASAVTDITPNPDETHAQAVNDSLAVSPRISLVVCTTARSDRISALVPRLSAVLDAGGGDVEVVLVDNSAAGGLTAADPRVRVVRCTTPGLSRARTVGCSAARGGVIVFTDDDVEFDGEWPLRMAGPVLAGTLDATAALVRLGDEFSGVTTTFMRQWLAEANLEGTPRLVGAGMALQRRLLDVGVWDERIGAGHPDYAFGEETLFEYMIRFSGARIGVAAGAAVIHHPDVERISEEFWHRTAFQKGLSEAYLARHWGGETMALPTLRSWSRRIRLLIGRRADQVHRLRLIEALGRAEGFRRLNGETPRYLPRPGAPE